MKRLKQIVQAKSLWFALILLLANGWAWSSAATEELAEVEPILHPHIHEIRAHWQARDAVGETFSVVITDQEAAETIAWYIDGHPGIPFSHPQVLFDPDGVTAGGLAHLAGLRTYVYGRGKATLVDGRPFIEVQELGFANASAPGFLMALLQEQVAQLQATYGNLPIPIEITHIELREGAVFMEGVYR